MDLGQTGSIRSAAEQMQALGPEHCIIGTDFGVYTLPEPVEGLREFAACLLDLGLPPSDIRKLVKTNPERLLGLS
jgi:microsomal dipeptidase-like Zn-dependent dipeptidase